MPPDSPAPAPSAQPARVPWWAWPCYAPGRELPLVAGLYFGVAALAGLAGRAGSAHFARVAPEEIYILSAWLFTAWAALTALWGAAGWLWKRYRPPACPWPLGWRILWAGLLFPFVLALFVLLTAFRRLGGFVLGMAAAFLGVAQPTLPELPPVPVTVPAALVALLAGLGALGIALATARGKRLRAAGAARRWVTGVGWTALGCATLLFAGHVLREEYRLSQLEARLAGAAPLESVHLLLPELQDPYERRRLFAAQRLFDAGEHARGAVPALLVAARDPNRGVRRRVAGALGKTGAPEAIPALLELAQEKTELLWWKEDLSSGVRYRARQALERIAPDALAVYLDAPEPATRAAVLGALRTEPGLDRVPQILLERMFECGTEDEWRAAYDILESHAPRYAGALPAVVRALNDPESNHACAAAWILGRMGLAAAPAVPDLIARLGAPDAPRLHHALCEALVELGPQARNAVELARVRAAPDLLWRLDYVLAEIMRRYPVQVLHVQAGPAEAPPLTPEARPGPMLEIRLVHQGSPLREFCAREPVVQIYDHQASRLVRASARNESETFFARVSAPGPAWITALVDKWPAQPPGLASPGDFEGQRNIQVLEGTNPPVEVEMKRILHLLEPFVSISYVDRGLGLPIFFTNATFRWESMGEGVKYRVTLVGIAPFSYFHQVETERCDHTWDLDPGLYGLKLAAFMDKREIGFFRRTRQPGVAQGGKPAWRTSETQYNFQVVAAEGRPVAVRFRLLFDGRPVTAPAGRPPRVTVQDLIQNAAVAFPVAAEAGRVSLANVPPGAYRAVVSLDDDPASPPDAAGDLYGSFQVQVRGDRDKEVDLHLQRVMRLLQPEDSRAGLLASRSRAGPAAVAAPVTFAWEGLGAGVEYEYYVPGYGSGRTKETRVVLNIPPRESSYSLSLKASKGQRPIGILLLEGEKRAEYYPFKVVEAGR